MYKDVTDVLDEFFRITNNTFLPRIFAYRAPQYLILLPIFFNLHVELLRDLVAVVDISLPQYADDRQVYFRNTSLDDAGWLSQYLKLI